MYTGTDLVVDLRGELDPGLDDINGGKGAVGDTAANGSSKRETRVKVQTCWGRLGLYCIELVNDRGYGERGDHERT